MKKLLILGPGCPKCKKLAEVTEEAAVELGVDFQLWKVTDLNQIMSFGVMRTPALVVDGEIKFTGRVPSKEDIKSILQ